VRKQINALRHFIFVTALGLISVAVWNATAVAAEAGVDHSSVAGAQSSEPFTPAIILALAVLAMAVGFARRKRDDGIL